MRGYAPRTRGRGDPCTQYLINLSGMVLEVEQPNP